MHCAWGRQGPGGCLEEVVGYWKEAPPGFIRSGLTRRLGMHRSLNRDLKRGEGFALPGPKHSEGMRELLVGDGGWQVELRDLVYSWVPRAFGSF